MDDSVKANVASLSPADPLKAFRQASSGKAARTTPLSRRERYVLWAIAPAVLIPLWLGGSMLWWSNSVNLALALLPVIFALLPLRERHDDPAPSASVREVLGRILRFPIFWLGLLFVGYILIQALNYNWQLLWTENKRGFYMAKMPAGEFISWLPSGMKSPFRMTNAWQALMMWTVPWLAVCALWGTLRRRKAWRILLWMIAAMGPVITVVGIATQFTSEGKVMWIWPTGNAHPFGPFAYRGHGATMLALCLAAALSLFLYYQRTQARKSGIQWFALILGLTSLLGVIMSMARSGTVNALILVVITVGLIALRILWQRELSMTKLITGVLICLTAAGASVAIIPQSSWDRLHYRWIGASKVGGDRSVGARILVAKTTWHMFRDNPVTGWGAGSFRFYFPVYQHRDLRLMYPQYKDGRPFKRYRYFWGHAHSDPVQLLAEYGIAGCSFLLAGMAYWIGLALYRIRSMRAEHWILLLACLVTIAQSFLDIIFFNPAILLIFSLLLSAMGGQISYNKQNALQDNER